MVILNGCTLTLEEVYKVLYEGEEVCVSDESWKRVDASQKAVEKIVNDGKTVYGITTGFGKFSDVFIDKENVEELQLNLIRSHACGVGESFQSVELKDLSIHN